MLELSKALARGKVAYIKSIAGDDESAHAEEDNLYHAFVAAVAKGPDKELAELAEIILETEKIEFARWCA